LHAAAAALLLCLGAPHALAQAHASAERSSHGGTTTWHLNRSVLDALDVRVEDVQQGLPLPASSKHGSYRGLEFSALDQTALRFSESDGLPRALSGGSLRHAGGFMLVFPGGRADLRGFVLQPNARAPFALDVVGGDGKTWFTLDRGHYQLEDDRRTFALRYMNLRLSQQFARQLKRPEFAGLAVGGVDTLSPLTLSDAREVVSATCSAPWPSQGVPADIHMVYQSVDAESGVPDSIHFRRCGLPDANGVYQDAECTQTSSDRGVVFAPDTSLLNAGTTAVAWHQMFSHPAGSAGYPPYGNDQHPMLVWNLYRVDADGALRQIAASGVKHAFNTINKTCNCSDHTNNYPACEDSYSQYSNDVDAQTTPNYLGPRSEIVPARGQWGRCLSVFDKNCDAVQDADAGAQNDFQYRLIALERDIDATLQPGAQFYFEYWYVVRDQGNIYHAMGYRPITFAKLAGSGSAWIWQANPGTFVDGPVISQWVDPLSPPANAANAELSTPEGRARIAVRTHDLGGGAFRYDYAVMNFDFARATIDPTHPSEPNLHVLSADGFATFDVPVSPGVALSDIVFNDADTDATNDWSVTRDSAGVHWQAPADHTLDWGTLYRFSFTAAHAPLATAARLGVATPGAPPSYTVGTLAPLDDTIFVDGFDGA